VIASASAAIVGIVIAAFVVLVLLVLGRSVRVVQQGQLGVVKRVGRFHKIHEPGVCVLVPFVDAIARIDMREEPRVGDMQSVITKDNVSVMVNATIFSQVIDVRLALFEVSNYHVAVDQLARTALRAVFGGMTLDEALSERERINAELQLHMAAATEKWGVRLNRIEIVDIVPPQNIINAMAMQKEADQQKRAAILTSEGQQQAAINTAQGEKQANILRAEGAKQSAILDAEGEKEATILRAEAFKQSQIRSGEGQAGFVDAVYAAIHQGKPTPELLAVLQLDALQKIATSDNAKLVVPVETAGLLGAAQALKTMLADVPAGQIAGGNGSTP
jgi:regulator of protease activity HflC (stomatin/prohibitin superfamily)